MQTTVETLEQQIFSLNAVDRSRLLDNVVRSLDEDKKISAEWLKVAQRRSEELRTGKVQGIPLEQVLAELEADDA